VADVPTRTQQADEEHIQEALAEYGLPAESGRFLGMVREALRSVVTQPPITHAASQLTAAEARELSGIGLDADASREAYASVAEGTAARMTAILADARSVAATADLLGVTPARVRQLLNEPQPALFGIKAGGAWLVPNFQFVDGRAVPNMRTVLAALPPGLHAVEFFNWFTRPDPALRLHDEPVSPRSWLSSGGDADRVAAEAAQL
jgi:hypothetical protein